MGVEALDKKPGQTLLNRVPFGKFKRAGRKGGRFLPSYRFFFLTKVMPLYISLKKNIIEYI